MNVVRNSISLEEHLAFLQAPHDLAAENAYSDGLEDAGNGRGAFLARASIMLDRLEEEVHTECEELGRLVKELTGEVVYLHYGPNRDRYEFARSGQEFWCVEVVFHRTGSLEEDANTGMLGRYRVFNRFKEVIDSFLKRLEQGTSLAECKYESGPMKLELEIPILGIPSLKQFLRDQVRDNPTLKSWELLRADIKRRTRED